MEALWVGGIFETNVCQGPPKGLNDFYSFDGGATWTTVNQKSLPPGSYQVLVKNNLGCVSPQTNYIYLNNPNIPLTDYTVVQPTCDTKGSITINTVAKNIALMVVIRGVPATPLII